MVGEKVQWDQAQSLLIAGSFQFSGAQGFLNTSGKDC